MQRWKRNTVVMLLLAGLLTLSGCADESHYYRTGEGSQEITEPRGVVDSLPLPAEYYPYSRLGDLATSSDGHVWIVAMDQDANMTLLEVDTGTGFIFSEFSIDKAEIAPGSGSGWGYLWPTMLAEHGLTWDGDYLWLTTASRKTIAQIDPLTGAILREIACPANDHALSCSALAWDGNSFWTNGSLDQDGPFGLVQFDEQGNILAQIPDVWKDTSAMPVSLGYDSDTGLLVAFSEDQRTFIDVYAHDPENAIQDVISSLPVVLYPRATWDTDGEHFWAIYERNDDTAEFRLGKYRAFE